MSETLSKADVSSVLSQWKAGLLTNAQVHDWATDRFAVAAWDPEDGAVNEVLGRLDTMDMNLVTVQDVAILLAALGRPPRKRRRGPWMRTRTRSIWPLASASCPPIPSTLGFASDDARLTRIPAAAASSSAR